MSTTVHCALFNYERGGLIIPPDTDLICHRGYWDFTGLHAAFSRLPVAPDLICINEAKEWELWGEQGLRFAARVLGELFELPYVGEMGWLPLGKSAPALIYNPLALHLDYWGNNDPTVDHGKRNFGRLRLRRHSHLQFDVLADHFPRWSGAARTDRAKLIGKLGISSRRALLLGDLNGTASGEHWPQRDWSVAHPAKAHDKGRLLPDGTFTADTETLDYLIGRWEHGKRVGGAGFHAIPELAWRQGMAADKTLLPTVNENIDNGGGLLIDLGLLNTAWKDGLVPDSFHIDVPEGATRADYPSDHRLSAWTLDVAA